jgi:hypothetical protein
MRNHGLLDAMLDLDGDFNWPTTRYDLMTLCHHLQSTGCCAPTFKRALAAYYMASCYIAEAVEIARITEACADAGMPVSISRIPL